MPAFDSMHGVYGQDTVVRRLNIGSHRNRPAQQSAQPVAQAASPAASTAPLDPQAVLGALMTPEVFDELVDRVAARIERRVLDELERRGERNVPGVF